MCSWICLARVFCLSWSYTECLGCTPASAPWRVSMSEQSRWKVQMVRSSWSSGSIACSRARISPAALRVKVTARMFLAGTPRSSTMWAIRWVMTLVLPLPGPATISRGPEMALTAPSWSSFRPSRGSTVLSSFSPPVWFPVVPPVSGPGRASWVRTQWSPPGSACFSSHPRRVSSGPDEPGGRVPSTQTGPGLSVGIA